MIVGLTYPLRLKQKLYIYRLTYTGKAHLLEEIFEQHKLPRFLPTAFEQEQKLREETFKIELTNSEIEDGKENFFKKVYF